MLEHKKNNEEHISFSALLGPIARKSASKISATGIRLPFNEIVDQSNLDDENKIFENGDKRLAYKRANRQWHTDMSYRTNRATWSLLSAHIVPPNGGETEVARPIPSGTDLGNREERIQNCL